MRCAACDRPIRCGQPAVSVSRNVGEAVWDEALEDVAIGVRRRETLLILCEECGRELSARRAGGWILALMPQRKALPEGGISS